MWRVPTIGAHGDASNVWCLQPPKRAAKYFRIGKKKVCPNETRSSSTRAVAYGTPVLKQKRVGKEEQVPRARGVQEEEERRRGRRHRGGGEGRAGGEAEGVRRHAPLPGGKGCCWRYVLIDSVLIGGYKSAGDSVAIVVAATPVFFFLLFSRDSGNVDLSTSVAQSSIPGAVAGAAPHEVHGCDQNLLSVCLCCVRPPLYYRCRRSAPPCWR